MFQSSSLQITFLWPLDSGLIFLLLLLDFSAVFNTIDHNMLLQRLEHAIDTEITTLEWFESYLSNRLQSNSKSF